MTPKVLYRISAVFLTLFAILHTVGFQGIDPQWGVDALIRQMRETTFVVQGLTRSYWSFYFGLGISGTVWLLLAALVAWQLGGLTREALASLPLIRWGMVVTMVAIAWLSWRYIILPPVVLSAIIALGLGLAAWRSRPVAN